MIDLTPLMLAAFGKRRGRAIDAYMQFVRQGRDVEPIWDHLNRRDFLGNDTFVAKAMRKASVRPDDLNIPRAQRRPPAPSLQVIAGRYPDRDTAIRAAWATGAYSYMAIAEQFGVHFTTVGRIVRAKQ